MAQAPPQDSHQNWMNKLRTIIVAANMNANSFFTINTWNRNQNIWEEKFFLHVFEPSQSMKFSV